VKSNARATNEARFRRCSHMPVSDDLISTLDQLTRAEALIKRLSAIGMPRSRRAQP
jgi:hypothetical protein